MIAPTTANELKPVEKSSFVSQQKERRLGGEAVQDENLAIKRGHQEDQPSAARTLETSVRLLPRKKSNGIINPAAHLRDNALTVPSSTKCCENCYVQTRDGER
jgi:hypothetical protein